MHARKVLVGLVVLTSAAVGSTSTVGPAVAGGDEVFIPGARLNPDHTATLPLYRGRSAGETVWFTVTEASDSEHASRWKASVSQKLENAARTNAVQRVTVDRDGTIVFPATVDFSPDRVLVPGPDGFPPAAAAPGAVGRPGYSPLIRLPDGAVLNAPHLANDSGRADKAVRLDTATRRVRLTLTDGFSRGEPVAYISFEASDPGAAAIENVTYTPTLNAAPFAGGDGTDSARASLAAFVNGPTGIANPERQGLNSALLGEGDPLNVLAWLPNQGRYSPLWDVHLTEWAAGVRRTRQERFADVQDLAEEGDVTAPGGAPWRATGFIVNCPIVATR